MISRCMISAGKKSRNATYVKKFAIVIELDCVIYMYYCIIALILKIKLTAKL